MNEKRIAIYLSISAFAGFLAPPTVAQDASAGERLFRQRCASCNSVQPGRSRIGPGLAGLVGRKAASVDGAGYSKAMQDVGLTWDIAQLEAFLANPRTVIAGTTMTVSVPNAADRTNIVTYH